MDVFAVWKIVVDFFGGIGATISFIVGTFLAIIFGIIPLFGKRKKMLSYKIEVTSLINENFNFSDKFSAIYNNNPVKFLSLVDIYLWNSGTETIHEMDLDTGNSLSVNVSNGGNILEVQTIKHTNEANKLMLLKINENLASIKFKYLDKGDGFKVSMLTGGSDDGDITITGDIRGVGKPRNSDEIRYKIASSVVFLIALIIVFSLYFVNPTAESILRKLKSVENLESAKILIDSYQGDNSVISFIAILVIQFLWLVFMIYSNLRKFTNKFKKENSKKPSLIAFIRDFW
jgi:hypothetical protein